MNTTGPYWWLVQVKAWCRQATGHYLSRCWLSSLTPYGVTTPQWVKVNYRFCFPVWVWGGAVPNWYTQHAQRDSHVRCISFCLLRLGINRLYPCSPVKIWEDPPQIATKTKWLPSCREFCVYFKNEKFTKTNRVEPFQISLYILGHWEKLLKKWQSIFFSQLWKIYLYLQPIWFIYISIPNSRLCGWLITKLFEGLYTEICKFKIKYFSSHLTSRRCFPHNFVIIQQICLVDGFNCFYKTHACYEQQEAHLWNIFSDQYPLLLPLPPKFQNYIASHI